MYCWTLFEVWWPSTCDIYFHKISQNTSNDELITTMIRINSASKEEQSTQPHTTMTGRVDRSQLVIDFGLSDSEYDSSDDEDETPDCRASSPASRPRYDSVRFSTKRASYIPKSGTGPLTNSVKALHQPRMRARGVTLPKIENRVQMYPKNGKVSKVESLRREDSMLLAKKRVPKCICHGHNDAAWWNATYTDTVSTVNIKNSMIQGVDKKDRGITTI